MGKIGQLTTTRRKLNEKIKLREKYDGDKDNYHWIILVGSEWIEIYSYKDKSMKLDTVRDFSIASGGIDISEEDYVRKAKIVDALERKGFKHIEDFKLY